MQGLDKNRYQFALLVLVNAFVGAMLGLERSKQLENDKKIILYRNEIKLLTSFE